jgi:cob(I)alamin adenosyltransferase
MGIYTKTGDKGTTSLADGTRVSKASARVMAYGDIDELISHLGILRSKVSDDIPLRRIQVNLMNVSAHLATEKFCPKLKALDDAEVAFLEAEIDRMTAALPPQKTFLLPAGPFEAAECHVARTVCRRCERSVIAIGELRDVDRQAQIYLNRLSDYLFTLARHLCVSASCEEDKWLP